RGWNFLIGLAVLWLGYRLYNEGVFHEWGLLSAGYASVRGPGAVIVIFIVEAVITVGMVTTLVATGLWSGIMHVVALANDAAAGGLVFLRETAEERRAARRTREEE